MPLPPIRAIGAVIKAEKAIPVFRSTLKAAVADQKAVRSGTEWLQWLESQGNQSKYGFKKAEIEATGLDDYLRSLPKEKIKAETLDTWMQNNGVQVEERVLKSNTEEIELARQTLIAAQEKVGRLRHAALEAGDRAYAVFQKDSRTVEELEKANKEADEINAIFIEAKREAERARDALDASYDIPETRYSDYQLPGGSDYKELLLKLPVDTRSPKTDKIQKNLDAISASDMADDMRAGAQEQISFMKMREQEENIKFRSNHFPDDPNLLAHVRFNTRTDAQGKKILFIEEIQSDWAQTGREDGFSLPPNITAPLDSEYRELVHKNTQARAAGKEPDAADIARAKELEALLEKSDKSKVAAAPFVQDTKSWTALAMKRMVRYAADNGFDGVAWTTGEQQYARFPKSQKGETTYKGMTSFYDQIVPSVADEVLKKVGGSGVSKVRIQRPSVETDPEEAVRVIEGRDFTEEDQPGFYLSDKMREKARQPMPLFQAAGAAAVGAAAVDSDKAEAEARKDYGKRNDGTQKDIGFLGEQKLPNGDIATEFSIGVQFDGKETEIPTLVPSLTEEELELLRNDIIPNKKDVPENIINKAVDHAKGRMKEGKSPFFSSSEAQEASPKKPRFYKFSGVK